MTLERLDAQPSGPDRRNRGRSVYVKWGVLTPTSGAKPEEAEDGPG
jgi:hypothetical protein